MDQMVCVAHLVPLDLQGQSVSVVRLDLLVLRARWDLLVPRVTLDHKV